MTECFRNRAILSGVALLSLYLGLSVLAHGHDRAKNGEDRADIPSSDRETGGSDQAKSDAATSEPSRKSLAEAVIELLERVSSLADEQRADELAQIRRDLSAREVAIVDRLRGLRGALLFARAESADTANHSKDRVTEIRVEIQSVRRQKDSLRVAARLLDAADVDVDLFRQLVGVRKPARAFSAAERARSEKLFTERVGPFLDQHCSKCHGSKRKGGLSLTSYNAAVLGGRSGPALEPGNAKASLLWQLVSRKKEPFMPPASEAFGSAALEDLREWIDTGATWVEPDKGREAKE